MSRKESAKAREDILYDMECAILDVLAKINHESAPVTDAAESAAVLNLVNARAALIAEAEATGYLDA